MKEGSTLKHGMLKTVLLTKSFADEVEMLQWFLFRENRHMS